MGIKPADRKTFLQVYEKSVVKGQPTCVYFDCMVDLRSALFTDDLDDFHRRLQKMITHEVFKKTRLIVLCFDRLVNVSQARKFVAKKRAQRTSSDTPENRYDTMYKSTEWRREVLHPIIRAFYQLEFRFPHGEVLLVVDGLLDENGVDDPFVQRVSPSSNVNERSVQKRNTYTSSKHEKT